MISSTIPSLYDSLDAFTSIIIRFYVADEFIIIQLNIFSLYSKYLSRVSYLAYALGYAELLLQSLADLLDEMALLRALI